MRKNQILYDVLFSIMLLTVAALQIVIGSLALIYFPELGITSHFWQVFFNSFIVLWIAGSSILFLGLLIISITLIISDIRNNKQK